MMGNAIRKIVHLDRDRTVSIEVPPEMGDAVELIVLACPDGSEAGRASEPMSEDEAFLVAAYAAAIEQDSEEDQIWERYLHAG